MDCSTSSTQLLSWQHQTHHTFCAGSGLSGLRFSFILPVLPGDGPCARTTTTLRLMLENSSCRSMPAASLETCIRPTDGTQPCMPDAWWLAGNALLIKLGEIAAV